MEGEVLKFFVGVEDTSHVTTEDRDLRESLSTKPRDAREARESKAEREALRRI